MHSPRAQSTYSSTWCARASAPSSARARPSAQQACASAQASYIRARADLTPSESPTPEAGAQLCPKLEAYLKTHAVQQVLKGLIVEMMELEQLPAEPLEWFASRLEAVKVRPQWARRRASPPRGRPWRDLICL